MILVTGATGSVGSQLVSELRDRGVPARAFVRDRAKAARMLGDGADLAIGDFSDAASIRGAMEGTDSLFLACANQPGQVEHEIAVIDAAATAGAKRIVKLSAIGAEIGSPLAFWDGHGRIEQHLHQSGVPGVILRPSSYMSNLFATAETVRGQGKVFAPADGARIGMIDPRDVAAVAALALTEDGHDGHTYELTGQEAITYERVAVELYAATGQRVEFVDVPDEGARQGMLAAGMPQWLADQLVCLFGLMRQGALERITDTVRALTGREPRTLAQFLKDYAALFQA